MRIEMRFEKVGRLRRYPLALVAVALATVVLGCTSDEDAGPPAATATSSGTSSATPSAASPATPKAASIVCSTAYRVSTREPLTEVDRLRFGAEDSTQSMPYIYLELHGQYTAGKADGERALRLWVTPTGTDRVLLTQLFQLPRDTDPTNQFSGGHGFTGLTYAYDPVSGAELQYWCEAN